MSQLPTIVSDLALILILAGGTTLLFKWIKQPVVLGYIVAGFFASSHFSFFPTVKDDANIDIWAQIGIIVLLFCLGLEFSFKKLVNVGGSAVIAVVVIVLGMISLGLITGTLLNFTWINSLFLGAMLSMSSTTIIIKALTDLNMRKQKFTGIVFGVLIVEDLFAIIIMVLLSSIAVNNTLEGGELIFSILKLIFFLVIWFLIGIYLIPSFFKRNMLHLNAETLLILAMGLCLGMVVLATYAGFSAALGAFVMGSILAGTNEAERIEKVMEPIKNLFGAIFFVSVGMLVQPSVLVLHFVPVIVISVVVIVGQIIFSTGGLLLAGQPLKIALQSGLCLSQIGEFAFIIAALGMSLGVIEPYLYPIVVAVSVITTFTTPYFIKMSKYAADYVEKLFPQKTKTALTEYSDNATAIHPKKSWRTILFLYTGKVAIYAIILVAIILVAKGWVIPIMRKVIPSADLANHISAAIVLIAMSPFLWALMLKPIDGKSVRMLVYDSGASPVPFLCLVVIRFLVGIFMAFYLLASIYSVKTSIIITLLLLPLLMILSTKPLRKRLLKIENKFMDNLNERELRRNGKKNNLIHNMHIAHMDVKEGCQFIGKRLGDANIRQVYGVNIVSIKRGNKRIDIPKNDTRIFPGDIIAVVGTDQQIQNFLAVVEVEDSPDEIQDEIKFELGHYLITENSTLTGKTITESQFRQNNCLVVGVENQDGDFLPVTGETVLDAGDTIWLVGDKQVMESVAK